ncbi:3939_t:CDS:2, partial [Gigaspora margarita]
CSKKRSKVKTELKKSILVLGKIIRGIRDGKVSQLNSNTVVFANNNISYINKKLDLEIGLLQLQSLDVREQDLQKKYLIENTISRNKEIQKKVKKHYEMIVNNQDQMLVSFLNKPYNKIIINKIVLEKQDHSRELITKPEEVMSVTEKHFQNQYQKKNARP